MFSSPMTVLRRSMKRRRRGSAPRPLARALLRLHTTSSSTQRETLRKKKPKTLKRRITLVWKRISQPSRPRVSRRFSFIPAGFVMVRLSRTKSREARKSKE